MNDNKKAFRVVKHVIRAAKKFALGTGHAAWIVGTGLLVLALPLVFEISKEQELQEMEQQQMGGVAPPPPMPPPPQSK